RVLFRSLPRSGAADGDPMSDYLLAIDQGTTSTRAIIFAASGGAVASAQQEFPQHFPQDGWVEHAAEDLWQSTLAVCRQALANAGLQAGDLRATGLTNQRETTLVWGAATGPPSHPATGWQRRRPGAFWAGLKAAGHAPEGTARTGPLIAPYSSASKLRWILDQVPGARE